MIRTIKTLCCILLVCMFVDAMASPVTHAGSQTNQRISELKAFVNEGITYIKKHGEKRACEEFNDQKGQFKKKNLYVFVVTYKGLVLAHGGFPKKFVGTNIYEFRDLLGIQIIPQFVEKAKHGGGVVVYYWPVPGTDIVQFKTSYIKQVPGKETFIGAGFYSQM